MKQSMKSIFALVATFSFVLMMGMAYAQEPSTKYVEAHKKLAELKTVDKSSLTSSEKKVLKAEIKAVKRVIRVEEHKMLAEAGFTRNNRFSPYGDPFFNPYAGGFYRGFYDPFFNRRPVVVVRRSRRVCRPAN